jgi:RNA polymerase sigma-70 factor (ECF subfamily)
LKDRDAEHEERCLVEAARGDPARFAELYQLHFDRVYAFIARRVPNRDEVQDLTADVFHQALANLARFEWRGAPFAAWLIRIASNAVADRARRSARRRQEPVPGGGVSGPLTIEAVCPDEVEERAKLYQLVRSLPADQRRVIVLRFVEEKNIRQIAEEIGRTEGAVKQLQFRALKTLRARMENAHG